MLVSSQENKKDLGYFKSNHWWQTEMVFQEETDFKCVERTSSTKWVKTAPGHGNCRSLNLPHPGSTNRTMGISTTVQARTQKTGHTSTDFAGPVSLSNWLWWYHPSGSSRPYCIIQGLHDYWCYQGPTGIMADSKGIHEEVRMETLSNLT